MILICIIVAVIGSFILLKAEMDEWLGNSSMNRQSRLSLRRNSCREPQDTCDNVIEISDDDSIDLSSNVRKRMKEYTNHEVTSHGTTSIPNSMTNASKYDSKHDISDDLSSDEDVIVVNKTSNNDTPEKSQSMFNWPDPVLIVNPLYQNNFPGCSSSCKGMESPLKRQKLMTADFISLYPGSSDDESVNLDFLEKDDSSAKVQIQHEMTIAGTKVKLPVKPYPCQTAVMNSLIQGCHKERNCLLESPTGSGKTLALLCGALAWQEQYSERIVLERSPEKSNEMDTECSCYEDYDGSNNFFLNSSRYLDQELNDKILSKKETLRVPKIFYGTRTHKQIKQVVKEFGKTAYRHKRMTILSSRKYTCIQETNKNKDKLCNELLDPRLKVKECKYYNDHVKKRSTRFNQMDTPWDIEDLISVGKEIGACPYFGARTLMANAEIIFCPYNYILNPEIRESMQIYLKGNIVILDEAHNVEDICREAATVMLRDDKIAIAIKECQHLLDKGCDPNIYTTIHKYLKDFIQFLQGVEVQENGFDKMISKAWYGIEFRVVLDLNNIGRRKFPVFLKASIEAIEDFKNNMKQDNPEKIKPTISQDTRKLLEYLYFAMQMIESDNYVNDYRIYVLETNEPTEVTEAQWFSSTVKKLTKVRTLTLRCMNPAIIFAPLAQDVRSVILASGTLTPTTSFQSELGTQFPYIINPNHIIPKNQIYIRCIAQGPKGKPLLAKYNTVNTWDFQDELGNLILQVCDAVPYGVLCFFSSYKVMNAIHDRWKNNYVWNRLSGLKRIFVEPKNDQELSPVMEAYRDVIKESSSKSYRTSCGAILFAVFRAKVAEGIDFSDNEARCVLGIGIPYLFLNSDVSMKMDYNNKSNESRSLLSGSEWYTVNAFRALNQAIGRCVRHKNDWGAVLLVDKRFEQKENVDYLPKWVKTNIKSNKNYDLEIELQDFVVMQVAREKGEKEKLMEN